MRAPGVTSLREIGRSVGNAVLEGVGRAASRVQESTPLAADVLESESAYLAVFDAPGATTSDVQVRYRDGAVLVRIDRFRDFHEGFEMRVPGRGLSLDGRVDLPRDARVDPEAASATLRENGTLEVRVPKRDPADPPGAGESPGEPDGPGADDAGHGSDTDDANDDRDA